MKNEKKLYQVGSFCPQRDCPDYGEVAKGTIVKFGRSKQGKQRYRCNTCKRSFNENHGTLFYRKRTAEKDILETLYGFR